MKNDEVICWNCAWRAKNDFTATHICRKRQYGFNEIKNIFNGRLCNGYQEKEYEDSPYPNPGKGAKQ